MNFTPVLLTQHSAHSLQEKPRLVDSLHVICRPEPKPWLVTSHTRTCSAFSASACWTYGIDMHAAHATDHKSSFALDWVEAPKDS